MQTTSAFDYPQEPILLVRPCLVVICRQNRPAAKLLSGLLYHARGCQPDQETFIYQRKQEDLVKVDLCGEISTKTLHDTAIPALKLLGFIEVDESSYVMRYTIYLSRVRQALAAYKQGKEPLEKVLIDFIKQQLEKVLIQLEKLLIDKKNFQLLLEKFLIVIRKISNSRGRKGNAQASAEAPEITRDKRDSIGDNRESGGGSASATPSPAQFAYQIQGWERFYYHDYCIHAGDRGINDGMTFILKNLGDVPHDAECQICYKPVHGPHGYGELPESDEPYTPDFSYLTSEQEAAPVVREVQRETLFRAAGNLLEKNKAISAALTEEKQDSYSPEPPQAASEAAGNSEKTSESPEKPNKRRTRKPAAPKVDAREVETYLNVFDELYQEVTSDPDSGYGRTEVDRKAITDLLKANLDKPRFVTPEKLRAVYRSLFKKPKDEQTGFCWADNMSIKAVCRNYAKEAMALTVQAQQKQQRAAQSETNKKPERGVSGLGRWTPPMGMAAITQ